MAAMATLVVLLLCACGHLATAQAPPKLPNIGYIGFGYNVFFGNPQDTSDFDPGFGQVPLFTFSYQQQQTTTDGKWLIPDNVAVPGSATECTVQGSTTTIQSAFDYQSSLNVDAEVDVSGFKASFSASTDYKKVEESTSSNDDVYVSTSASCETYLVDVNPYIHPNLSSVLVTQGSLLPITFDPKNGSAFWEFFDYVGTHFPTRITFGSRWGYSFQSSQSQWSTMQKIGLDVSVAASYAGLIKAGVKLNTSYAEQLAANFTSLTTQTFEYGLGTSPPPSGSSATWLQDALSSSLMDPLKYDLTPISELFGPEYSTSPQLHARYAAVSDALSSYCPLHLLPTGILTSCLRPPTPPPPPAPVGYGAFACGSSCWSQWAAVFDGSSNMEAQEVLLDQCVGCTIISTFSNGECIALAVAPKDKATLLESGSTLAKAEAAAISECQKFSQGGACTVSVSGCSVPPPANAKWGAIACTGNCDSFFTTKEAYPDRLEAHHVAMESLTGSYVAIDYDQCGAIVKSSNGFSSANGDTPQDANSAAMKACQATMQDCHPLSYGCVNPTKPGVIKGPSSKHFFRSMSTDDLN